MSRSAPETLRRARLAWARRDFQASLTLYQAGYRASKQQSNISDASRFLIGIGVCQLNLFQYQKAADAFLEGRRLALSIDDHETVGLADLNLGSLYLATNDESGAAAALEAGLAAMRPLDGTPGEAQMSSLLGVLYGRRGDHAAAVTAFQTAVALARAQGDDSVEASAWDHLGNELLHQGDLPAAEHALLEGFRIRRLLAPQDVFLSYSTLADLKLREGDPHTARSLIEVALSESLRAGRSIPLYVTYYQRGEIREAQNDLRGALEDFGKSITLARTWRLELVPSTSARTGTDVNLSQIYASYIEAGNRLYFSTPRGSARETLAQQTFLAKEDGRAASLREKLAESASLQSRLPKDYWGKLAKLRDAETLPAQAGADANNQKIGQLSLQLTEMEEYRGFPLMGTVTTYENYLFQNSLISCYQVLHRVLSSREAFLSFHLGTRESYLWAATKDHLFLYRLAPEREIAGLAQRFAEEVRLGSGEGKEGGKALYSALFGGLAPEVKEKRNWLMALEGALFKVPFAAMPAEGKDQQYFVQRHSIQIVPAFWLLKRQPDPPSGPFVGVGDPVYNTADPRFRRTETAIQPAAGPEPQTPLLERLVSSGVEVAACARAWWSQMAPVVLTGEHATFDNVRLALARQPSVLHIATHVVEYGDGQPRIALSLRSSGPELISGRDISMLRIPGCQVVMSGCGSGAGKVLPGAGLLGLSRAWLAAGASSVVASYWITPDDTGELFLSFYRRLGDLGRRHLGGGAAEALRQAQLEMLRSATWRSSPRYWAALFANGGTR